MTATAKTSNGPGPPVSTAVALQDPGSAPLHAAENTDLERRVLAHERILQTLIAHMAEVEPRLLERLRTVFSDSMRVSRPEHDYTDTDAYAEQFIRGVLRLGEQPRRPQVARGQPQSSLGAEEDAEAAAKQFQSVATLFQVRHRAGIWEVTKDGEFLGHYHQQQPAWDAVAAAASAVVADGGSAETSFRAG